MSPETKLKSEGHLTEANVVKEEVDPLLNYLEEDKEVEKFKVNFDDDEDELICVEDLN